jgi:hypothetical protein
MSSSSVTRVGDVSTPDGAIVQSAPPAGAASISDIAYAASWNGVTDVAPSKNAVYDKIETLAAGSGHTIKDETTSLAARTNLNFTGAGVVATDNAGTNSTDVTIAGGGGITELYTAVTVQSITSAATAITATDGSPYRLVSSDAAYTLTAQPTIASGRNGQAILVKNVGSFNIVLQDVNALGGSLLRLTANTLIIQPGGTMKLVYDSTIGFWIEQYLLNPQTFTPSVSSLTSQLATTREVAAASTLDTAPNFTIGYVGTPSAASIDVSAGGDPSTLWPITVPSPYTALDGGTSPPTQQFYRATTINGTRVFTVTATVAGVGGLTRTLTFTYINNRFVGNNTKNETQSLTEAEMEALTTALSDSRIFSGSVAGGGNRLWFAYPSRLGAALFASIDGEIANWVDRGLAVTVTNPSGYAETYQQWCTSVTVAGTVTLVTATSAGNNRIYMGPGPVTDPITNANILALDDTADGESIVSSTVARTYTAIKIEAGEYLWFVHPDRIADLATIKQESTGFGIAGSYRTNVSHTNQYGYVETYRCWRSDNANILPAGDGVIVT